MVKNKKISPQKWDTVKDLIHESWKNPDSKDGTFIILDDDDLKILKGGGFLKYDEATIVYARKKAKKLRKAKRTTKE